ncbi:primosomal protein N' [Prochlorococcus sp. MIT 1223]|uniref:replication restart helicase PriA n=1 Tax=Prochlorococcus sp. MIT 1223 TaxID=3096217 RepID=UPI002A757BDE|nr:primosomal protein N' [Prochlorococcus sp. MIT 1223]
MEYQEFEVWLEIGREGKCFTYKDGLKLGISFGDLVLVRLRGRPMHGLVVEKKKQEKNNLGGPTNPVVSLSNIEALVQKAAVDNKWREWLEETALNCYTSPYRMLKTALPPGWLGQVKKKSTGPRMLWWIQLKESRDNNQNLSVRQKELENFLYSVGGGVWMRDLKKKGFAHGLVNGFVSRGLATRERKQEFSETNNLFENEECLAVRDLEEPQLLTEEQRCAVDVFDSILPGTALLLWGVTGSGKTEVYLQVAANELSAGKNCLMLTPEIGLVPQLVDRFRRRFGDRVMEYHSNCSEKERVKAWRKILNSTQPLVIVGTRSAIFLPLSPLGLIILDEEHDTSYKQESPMPCYHARDIALNRALKTGAKVILGSATPSLSTWRRLSPRGPISLARLKNRISKRPLPKVHIVDMRKELQRGNRRLISRSLMQRLLDLRTSRGQAVILVPKRGYSSFLSCRSCGEVVQCPFCDIALTVHKSDSGNQWLRCHWCDYRAKVEMKCKECGSTAFKPFGAGTQRVMENLTRELEGLKLLRFDRDSTSGRDGHRTLLDKFAGGEADILVGTQMLAKGMDLPRVTLAVVLAADSLLYRPDLSAEEQALQLFMQLAGRAGRGERPGEVVVQTYCPEHPVVLHLRDGLYEEFLRKESQLRKESGLVPFSRACLLRFSGDSAERTSSAAFSLAEKIKPICKSNQWKIVGPAPALVAKASGKSRWQLLLHGPELSPLPLPEGDALWRRLPKGVSLSVDPDPIQL